MRNLIFLFFIVLAISVTSCRKDFSTIPSFGQLEFSRDTVYLDTVFTNIGSATYNLKVYNRSNKDITIPTIGLERGNSSNYRLNVDGIPGKTFDNIDILARDSIFIFVETTVDVTSVPDPLYTDRILFDNGTNQQDVDLVTLVQDATFIFPGRDPISMEIDQLTLDGEPTAIQGRFLEDSELIFTNARPYVVYGYAAVPANKTLVIDAGARIHFHDNSGLIIDRDASLKVNGTLNEKVVFEGDRLEHVFSNVPGQWGTIWMREGSKENEIHHAEIKNAIIGVLVDATTSSTPTLTLKNTQVYNHSNFGILGRGTSILGENVVVGSAGEASFAGTVGGSYDFTHSTFANYWNNGIRALPAVLVNNFFTFTNDQGQEVIEPRDLTQANFINCIIDGNNNVEFIPDRVDGATFNFNVSNSMIKFNDINGSFTGVAELDFTDTNLYQNITLNGFADFRNTSANDFIIGQASDAIGLGDPTAAAQVPMDILGVIRTLNPDLGAYQHISF
ncbi:hypothetical protein [Pseudotenacibaculum haliotis]|uniref:Right-handed parallel beta-helix repeat-containing protein n=1 Tax=Pseudotenacibaculum haliotis TaxID=1862138 RepID=A0ABW5LQT9_9FLAO